MALMIHIVRAGLGLSLFLFPALAHAREIESLFLVSKSENRNQVHYALAVDESCAPVGPTPIRAYWRMLEKGPTATEPLLDREQSAYGLASQLVKDGVVTAILRALPSRPIVVHTWRGDNGTCHAASRATIDGVDARLFNVHVALKLFGVDYLLLTGWSDDGRTVREKI